VSSPADVFVRFGLKTCTHCHVLQLTENFGLKNALRLRSMCNVCRGRTRLVQRKALADTYIKQLLGRTADPVLIAVKRLQLQL
jgi:hypothetical protein